MGYLKDSTLSKNRNESLIAIAPMGRNGEALSSAVILANVSQGIEPIYSDLYMARPSVGKSLDIAWKLALYSRFGVINREMSDEQINERLKQFNEAYSRSKQQELHREERSTDVEVLGGPEALQRED